VQAPFGLSGELRTSIEKLKHGTPIAAIHRLDATIDQVNRFINDGTSTPGLASTDAAISRTSSMPSTERSAL
jgi:hypothetical protein